ncbi:MAG: 2-phosphosulfolactate phosphatase [Betaproteobacteria bacterium]|nr:2-phosphosulfolactate phosphatase [Betaproteobacteria bacterium]
MKSVVIDFSPESAARYRRDYAMVAIDVIRATTTLATGVASGRQCYVASSVKSAFARAARLDHALLAGESGGEMPGGFDITNSPAALALRADIERPMVLLSSTGTQLLTNARGCEAVYVACFRNHRATAEHLARHHARVAVIGAGTKGEFREEDQICCAWIAGRLMSCGYVAENARTRQVVERWQDAPAGHCLISNSVAYLRRTNQLNDLDFVLTHVGDLDTVIELDDDQAVPVDSQPLPRVAVAGA